MGLSRTRSTILSLTGLAAATAILAGARIALAERDRSYWNLCSAPAPERSHHYGGSRYQLEWSKPSQTGVLTGETVERTATLAA